MFQGAIRITLEMVLEEEVKAMVGARRFERIGSRRDHRNGTFLRRFLTSMGFLVPLWYLIAVVVWHLQVGSFFMDFFLLMLMPASLWLWSRTWYWTGLPQ